MAGVQQTGSMVPYYLKGDSKADGMAAPGYIWNPSHVTGLPVSVAREIQDRISDKAGYESPNPFLAKLPAQVRRMYGTQVSLNAEVAEILFEHHVRDAYERALNLYPQTEPNLAVITAMYEELNDHSEPAAHLKYRPATQEDIQHIRKLIGENSGQGTLKMAAVSNDRITPDMQVTIVSLDDLLNLAH